MDSVSGFVVAVDVVGADLFGDVGSEDESGWEKLRPRDLAEGWDVRKEKVLAGTVLGICSVELGLLSLPEEGCCRERRLRSWVMRVSLRDFSAWRAVCSLRVSCCFCRKARRASVVICDEEVAAESGFVKSRFCHGEAIVGQLSF